MEASECHFLIGMCHIELKGYHEAKDAFTSAVKINPNYAQVRLTQIHVLTRLIKIIKEKNMETNIDEK